ncbi:MAG: hypothetical protein NVV72_10270 [Asticcacaulis sp.]|nr:hypothetical protein [Asticcacaulis sp.]
MSSGNHYTGDVPASVHHGDTPPPSIELAIHAQAMSEDGNADPFPPEGTDDKLVQREQTGDKALSDDEGLRAARYVIATGLTSAAGGTDRGAASPPDGRDTPSGANPPDTRDVILSAEALADTVAAQRREPLRHATE